MSVFFPFLYIMILKLLLVILIATILILNLKRYQLYQKMIQLNKKGVNSTDENLLYDDYYNKSVNKKNNKLVCQIGVFRKFFFSSDVSYDIELLYLNHEDSEKILIVSNYDSKLNLEKSIINKYPQLEIISFTSNLLLAQKQKQEVEINKLNQITIAYGAPDDIESNFYESDYKFDRILVRECLGNIKNRLRFFKDLESRLSPSGFVIMRTFTFKPIFEKNEIISDRKNREYHQIFEYQKKLIDYWNYNFSTTQSIVNDLSKYFNHIEYDEIPMLQLAYLYNFQDFKKAMKIYLLDMGFNLNNLYDWQAISTLQVLVLRLR